MLFRDGEDSLRVDVANYELPQGGGEPGSDDNNWLMLRAVWRRDGEITVDSNCCLLTYELQELAAGLKVLQSGIRGEYESDFTEPYFSVYATAEGSGPERAFRMDVSFYLPNTMDGEDTAEISCAMDAAALRELIGELDRLCTKFPDRK